MISLGRLAHTESFGNDLLAQPESEARIGDVRAGIYRQVVLGGTCHLASGMGIWPGFARLLLTTPELTRFILPATPSALPAESDVPASLELAATMRVSCGKGSS